MRDSMGEENRNPLEGLLEVRREVRRLCPELAPKEERVTYRVDVADETDSGKSPSKARKGRRRRIHGDEFI